MGFQGVLRALYSYAATNAQELSLEPNDLVYLLETADDGWWTVKKRVPNASSAEPQGLVPHNYVTPAQPESTATALFDYSQQTPDEIGFKKGDVFDVYAPDGDWVLVGLRNTDRYGFVPFNYLQYDDAAAAQTSGQTASQTTSQTTSQSAGQGSNAPGYSAATTTATTAVSMPSQHVSGNQSNSNSRKSSASGPRSPDPGNRPSRTFDDPESPPPMPARPARPSRPKRQPSDSLMEEDSKPKEARFEVQDVNGRRKTSKTLLLSSQYLILDGTTAQKWAVSDIEKYNQEKKHVFLELRAPRMSLDLKAESQAAAEQIVSTLGQMVGAYRGGGLEEVIALANSRKPAQIARALLDFKAANKREVSMYENEEVTVVNDSDKDWWVVRNTRGQQGLVPRKFVTTDLQEPVPDMSRSTSLSRKRSTSHAPPPPDKMRTWVDRSGSFRVEAQFLRYSKGKIHLHKENGVKIAVPASKLSFADLDFVEHETGANLSEYRRTKVAATSASQPSSSVNSQGRLSDRAVELCDWWLSMFLECRIDPQNANRYAKNFARDNMEESMLDEVTAPMLRTFGLREGDILRVMRRVNERQGKVDTSASTNAAAEAESADQQVWGQKDASVEAKPALVAQTTQTPQPMQPQLTQPIQPIQPMQPQVTQPVTQPAQPAQPVQPQLTQPVQPQLTQPFQQPVNPNAQAEADVAAQQRRTQQQILLQQAELQKEQIRLLKEQQEQLRRQQKELIEIQKTGSQLQSLGPFATGVAGMQQFNAPAPPVSRIIQPTTTGPFVVQPQLTQQMKPTTTGPFQPTTTGQFQPTTTGQFQPVRPTTTGPFQPAQPTTTGQFQPVRPTTTGPFQPAQPTTTGPFQPVQPTTTGPYQPLQQATGQFKPLQPAQPAQPQLAQLAQPVQPSTTGPFQAIAQLANRTGPFQPQPAQPTTTGPFQTMQQTRQAPTTTGPFQPTTTGPFQGMQPTQQVNPTTTGPFQGIQSMQQVNPTTTGPFQGIQSMQQVNPSTTGPFQGMQPTQQVNPTTTGPFQGMQPTQQVNPSTTGPFQSMPQLANRTGPFQPQQPVQPVQPAQPQSFANQFQQPTTTGPFQFQQPTTTGPFQQTQSTTGLFQPVQTQQTQSSGPFQAIAQLANRTGPFQPQQPTTTGPFTAQPAAQFQPQFQQPQNPMQQFSLAQPQQPQFQPTQPAQQPFSFNTQPVTQPAQQAQPAQQPGPLQSQATGFGFGNQERPRANVNLASASNPFGL